MSEAMKSPTSIDTRLLNHYVEDSEGKQYTGWKYRSLKLGPFTLPHYASPESQLILVSFVCFLCPGEKMQKNIYYDH
jgi:hypothetical protein